MKFERWTLADYECVAKSVLTAMGPKPFPNSFTTSDICYLAKLAQQNCLPSSKHRNITGWASIKVIVPHLVSELASRISQWDLDGGTGNYFSFDVVRSPISFSGKRKIYNIDPALKSKPCTNVESEITKIDKEIEELDKSKREIETINKLVLASLTTLTDNLSTSIADKVIAILNSQYTLVPRAQIRVKHNPEPVPDTGRKCEKLVIGIIGLLNNQQKWIQDKFPDVNFKFFDSYPKNMPPTVDHMVGMTSFMKHSTDEKAITRYGSRYHRHNNGMTSLASLISTFFKFGKGDENANLSSNKECTNS